MAKRTNKYIEYVQPYLEDIKKWARDMTDQGIAARLGVSARMFLTYKQQHEELKTALIEGRQRLVQDVRSRLISLALGYQYEERVEQLDDMGVLKGVTVYKKTKHPDPAACNMILKNYDENWRDKDAATYDLKFKQLELEEKKFEANNWAE